MIPACIAPCNMNFLAETLSVSLGKERRVIICIVSLMAGRGCGVTDRLSAYLPYFFFEGN